VSPWATADVRSRSARERSHREDGTGAGLSGRPARCKDSVRITAVGSTSLTLALGRDGAPRARAHRRGRRDHRRAARPGARPRRDRRDAPEEQVGREAPGHPFTVAGRARSRTCDRRAARARLRWVVQARCGADRWHRCRGGAPLGSLSRQVSARSGRAQSRSPASSRRRTGPRVAPGSGCRRRAGRQGAGSSPAGPSRG